MKRGDTTRMTSHLTSQLHLGAPHDRAMAERLYLEFEAALPPSVVHGTLTQAEHDLTGQIVPEAWPEMVYRLAQYRLGRLVSADAQR